jgi:hypothetical protein
MESLNLTLVLFNFLLILFEFVYPNFLNFRILLDSCVQIVFFVSLDMTFIIHIGIYMSHKYTFLDKGI